MKFADRNNAASLLSMATSILRLAIRCCVIKASLKAYYESTDPSTIRSGFSSAGIKIVNNQLFIILAAALNWAKKTQSFSTPPTPPRPK